MTTGADPARAGETVVAARRGGATPGSGATRRAGGRLGTGGTVVVRQGMLEQTAGTAIGTTTGDAMITMTGGEGTTGTGEMTETGGMTETGAKVRRTPSGVESSTTNWCSGCACMCRVALRTSSVHV